MAHYQSRNNEPLTRWNNHPIYLTTILTGLFVLGLIVSAVLGAMRSPLLQLLIFDMPLAPAWSVWRLFTYVFINQVSFFTPFSIFFFYWMSMGIETHVGRNLLVKLLVLLALVIPAVAAVWWFGLRVASSTFTNGDYLLFSGLLVAFATLYPQTEAWGWVPFKWVAFACIACGSLMLLAANQWVALSQLWCSCAVGFAYMNHAKELDQDDYESPFAKVGKLFERKPKFRVVEPPVRRRWEVEETDEVESIDPLLDKIARSGLGSLSAKERARLEKAREALIRKDRQ